VKDMVDEKFEKELAESKRRIRALEKENELIRKQFSFYVQYGTQPWIDDDSGGLVAVSRLSLNLE